jgi:hypothetical protein
MNDRCYEAVTYEMWMCNETYKKYRELTNAASTTERIDTSGCAVECPLTVTGAHPTPEPALQNPNTQFEQNVYLECFLLHVRNLRDFLYSKQKKCRDDIIAKDFYDTEVECRQRIGKKPAILLGDFTKRINKKLAHLSYFRGKEPEEEKGWKIDEIYNAMMPAIKNFARDHLGLLLE